MHYLIRSTLDEGPFSMNAAARCPWVALLGAATAIVVVPLGCGRSGGLERLPVGGTVTRAGGERFNGTITFLPADGMPGPAASLSLLNGEYQFDRHNGPAAGPHRVFVNKVLSKRSMLQSRGKPAASGQAAAHGPAKTQWTQSADVTAQGPYRFDFNLD
jgi:hypothetical protein